MQCWSRAVSLFAAYQALITHDHSPFCSPPLSLRFSLYARSHVTVSLRSRAEKFCSANGLMALRCSFRFRSSAPVAVPAASSAFTAPLVGRLLYLRVGWLINGLGYFSQVCWCALPAFPLWWLPVCYVASVYACDLGILMHHADNGASSSASLLVGAFPPGHSPHCCFGRRVDTASQTWAGSLPRGISASAGRLNPFCPNRRLSSGQGSTVNFDAPPVEPALVTWIPLWSRLTNPSQCCPELD